MSWVQLQFFVAKLLHCESKLLQRRWQPILVQPLKLFLVQSVWVSWSLLCIPYETVTVAWIIHNFICCLVVAISLKFDTSVILRNSDLLFSNMPGFWWQAATKILARQLVRLRQHIVNLQGSRAQIRGVATHTQVNFLHDVLQYIYLCLYWYEWIFPLMFFSIFTFVLTYVSGFFLWTGDVC